MLPEDYDSDDEEVKKAMLEKGPKRSVALKIAKRRRDDLPELPMARHQVQGLHGLEHHELVNVGALQSGCELLGEAVTVESMLHQRRLREHKERLRPAARWCSPERSRSWEERQAEVMARRQQRRKVRGPG